MFEEFNFAPGIVSYNDFNIDVNISLNRQRDSLKDDLFQVQFYGKFLIDVGWYSNLNGKFRIRVIKDYDWTTPLYDKKCKDLKTLNQYMGESIEMIRTLTEDLKETIGTIDQ